MNKPDSKWIAIRARGVVVVWMEVFLVASTGKYVSVPGASRFTNVNPHSQHGD